MGSEASAAGGKPAQKPSAAKGCLTLVVFIVIIGVVIAALSGGSSSSPAQRASSYIKTMGNEASTVQASVTDAITAVGLASKSPTAGNINQLAQVAQQAHNGIDALRDNFATTDTSGTVGNAEVEVFTAANDLKNAMGALVAYTGNPNPATLAQFTTQYQSARQEWNDGVGTIWSTAKQRPAPSIP